MIDVSETGVDFAREFMGWEDARLPKPFDAVVMSDNRVAALDVSDLNSVMAEVCEWCVTRRLTFSLILQECLSQEGRPLNVWKCSVSAGRRCLGSGSSQTDIAEAVMCACILASRRVRMAA
jgi:hypothetical protein